MKKLFLLILFILPFLNGFAQLHLDLAGYPLVTTGWTATSTTSAGAVVDSSYRFTNTLTNTASKIYYNTPINMAAWCQWTADFDIKVVPGSGGTADGIAFWFLNSVGSATGGGGIGLPTYPNGMVLIFDTYDNNSAAGADNPLITLLGYNGSTLDYTEGSTTGQIAPVLTNQSWITTSAWKHIKVTYYLGTIKVYLNYATAAAITTTAPYPLTINGYFGFSASTGAVTSTQSVKAVHIVLNSCLNAVNNGPLCQSDTLKLQAMGDSTSATYLWSGPNGFTSTDQNPIRPNVSYVDSGDYSVIKFYGGASDTETTHFSVKLNPIVTAGSNSPVCVGSPINLTSGPLSTGETFSWTSTTGYTSAVQNPTITSAVQSDSGFYTVIASLNGCKDTDRVHVNVVYVGVPWDSSNTPLCNGDNLQLYATDTATGVSWSWTGPGGLSSTLQNPMFPGVTAANTGIYTVTATIGTCSASDTILVTIRTRPAVPAIVPKTRICTSDTVILQITAGTFTPGAVYYWSGPNGFTSTLTSPIILNATMAASGLYSVYAVNGTCSTTVTYNNFLVDSTPVVPVASNNGPICSDSLLLLTATDATSGVTYGWAGPGSYTSTDQNPTIYNATTAMSGNYTVTAIYGLCQSKAVTTVLINPTPGSPSIGSNSPICSGQLLTLNASFTPFAGVFHWSGPNGFTSLVQNPFVTNASNYAAGTYSVYELLNGCTSDTIEVNVIVNSTPGTPHATNNSVICQGDTLMLYATDDTAGVTYAWAGPAGFTSTDQNPIILNIQPTQVGAYTVTAILGNCSSTTTTNVTITTTPPITLTNNGPICTGDTLKLVAVSDPGNLYTWSGPYVINTPISTLVGPTPRRFPAIMEYAGTYSVVVTNAGGCSNIATTTVVINPTPAAPWITPQTICQYDNTTPLMPVDATNVLWFASAAAGGVGTTVAPTPSSAVPGLFFYYLNQTVNGCISPIDSVLVAVHEKPSVQVTPTDTSMCPRGTVDYTASVDLPYSTVRWYPSTYLSDSTGLTTTAQPVADISYYVIATSQFNCYDTAMAHITVFPGAMVSVSTHDSVTLYPGESYQLNPYSNCSSFAWFPPEGLSNAHISDPIATPDISTMYIVTGITENGCVASDSVYFHVNEDNIYAMPNAFAPGNGLNNKFKLIVDGLGKLNYFRIYDRWGVLMFETKDINEGWDGTYNGTPQPFAVYVYDIQAVSSITGRIKSMRGNVTLLR